eukprot:5954882-Amphidinium_carterae.1
MRKGGLSMPHHIERTSRSCAEEIACFRMLAWQTVATLAELTVTLLERARDDKSPAGILGSKATGEPAYLASGATFWA